ncbi:unnamed protein product [Gadus morhua 'NCC']
MPPETMPPETTRRQRRHAARDDTQPETRPWETRPWETRPRETRPRETGPLETSCGRRGRETTPREIKALADMDFESDGKLDKLESFLGKINSKGSGLREATVTVTQQENRLKAGWLEELVETRDTLGQSHGRQLKRNPNDLKRNPNDLKRKPKPS